MPRRDWNTPTAHKQKPRHARMHSAARGKGHDKKIQAEKHAGGDRRERCLFCGQPTIDVSRHKRRNHPRED